MRLRPDRWIREGPGAASRLQTDPPQAGPLREYTAEHAQMYLRSGADPTVQARAMARPCSVAGTAPPAADQASRMRPLP